MKKIIIKKETYYDSVFLMLASKALKKIEGLDEAVATMATDTNKELLVNIGFDADPFQDLRPNDLILALEADNDEIFDQAVLALDDFLSKQSQGGNDTQKYRPVSLRNAIRFTPESNLVLISVPGVYAAREARLALHHDRHVMVFSDNVSIEEEIELKKLAARRGLMMMGPDCGTAIINGAPLCFANRIRRGNIGLVAASGSGLQEVTCCIHKMGAGISQALGTGGRDLKDLRVGGRMMKMGIEALGRDTETEVLVIISKPPADELAGEIIGQLETLSKPVVVCFLGQPHRPPKGNLHFTDNLTETARLAVTLSDNPSAKTGIFDIPSETIRWIAQSQAKDLHPSQKFIRGLYAGGTLADESIFGLQQAGINVFSNIHPDPALRLKDACRSQQHTIVDLGDDQFTVGRPHPMIDPSIRQERLAAELADPSVAVLLMDFVLGDGAHENPAASVVETLATYKTETSQNGHHPVVVVSITGTDEDYQDMAAQKEILEAQNCIVMPSNYLAGRVAAAIIQELSPKEVK